MKFLITGLLLSILLVGNIQGQNASKAFKRANKALKVYLKDPSSEEFKLQQAKKEIDMAVSVSDGNSQSEIWLLRGEVYSEISEISDQTLVSKQLGLGINDFPSKDDPAVQAFYSFHKALDLADNNAVINEALEGIRQTQSKLQNVAINSFDKQIYGLAYNNSINALNAHELLKSNNAQSILVSTQDYYDLLFVTGLSALRTERFQVADSVFQILHSNNYEKPMVYEALGEIHYKTGNYKDAYKYLILGRIKFPDDATLLIAEIEYLLKTNNNDRLNGRLEVVADQMDPDNVSFYLPLGAGYDQLFHLEYAAGNKDKAQEYFDKALEYYNRKVELNQGLNDATFAAYYLAGSLYKNKADMKWEELQNSSFDNSDEGMKKYGIEKAEVLELMTMALPYFEKAETINPNDINTLIALKEIYWRDYQPELYNEFEERVDKTQRGTRLKSYFKE